MRAGAVLAALLLAACAGGPVPPDWQADAHAALKTFGNAYLSGNPRLAQIDFAQARTALARTGRADLVSRAELYRCALQVAALEFDDCPGFLPLAAAAGDGERAYAEFLAGRWQGLDPERLPEAQRPLLRGGDTAAVLAGIAEPLPRLVAAGVLLRRGGLSPAGITMAVDTASAQGWRRPLLAWLGVQLERARAAGDAAAAEHLRQRIGIAGGSI